jgi:hypothetical protein
MPIRLTDAAGLGAAERADLERAVAHLTSLDRVVAWARGLRPAGRVEEFVAQDEFTHDVVLRLSQGRYLVLDTT